MILSSMITILISESKLRKRILSLSLMVAMAGTLGACGDADGTGDTGISVVATTSIWADVARQIVGENGTVTTIIPIGADSHDYQPSARQVGELMGADLIIANGLGLEQGFADVLETAASDGVSVLEIAPDVNPLPFADHEHEEEEHEEDAHEEGEEHEHGSLDPHVWFDPARVATATGLIAGQLAVIDDSIDWQARADAYTDDLTQAQTDIEEILSVVPVESRRMVTNHDAFGYFADVFGFEIVGVVIPGGSTLDDPSSAELAELVAEIEHENVSAIFAETTSSTALAEAVAAEVGREIAVVELYTESLDEPGTDAGTLIGMLLTNARRIAGALG